MRDWDGTRMKIIITTISPDIESQVDPRFGRGAYFLLVDPDTMEWQAFPNPAVSASGGAGIQAAQFASEQKAEAIISGDFGPNAYNAINAAGLHMYLFGLCRTAREAIEHFKSGQLKGISAPTKSSPHARSK